MTLTEAAAATGMHRATIRRRFDAGDFPNARRADGKHGPETGPWLVPVADLLAAGLTLHAPAAGDPGPSEPADVGELAELRAELAAERERRIRAEADAAVWRARAEERERTIDVATVALRALPPAPEKKKGWRR